jgi:hypothetical protein
MLYRQRLIDELGERRDEFVEFGREWAAEAADYAARVAALEGRAVEGIRREAEANLSDIRARAFGALPGEELERAGRFVLPFARRWRTHEEARGWAVDALLDRATFAADGSQILPGREVSMPVAAVQVAWFENPHARDGAGYRKEWDFRLVTPRELSETDSGPASAADLVSLHRFRMELKAVRAFLERRAGWRGRGERVPVSFFDGTLLLSTARVRGEALNFPGGYVEALAETVRLSRVTEVPVVGYIDQSYARDLVRLLDVLARRERRTPVVFDAQIFSAATSEDAPPLFANWGDRTIFCHCHREGLPEEFRDAATGEPLVGFVYLQTTAPGGVPARLDIPAWVGRDHVLLEDVIDAVRAECVVGNGYPYALETADEAAVITARDREQFLRAVQDFAETNQLAFRVSRKAVSKIHRR